MIETLKHPIVGYKKIRGRNGRDQIVTLIIPAGALVHYNKDDELLAGKKNSEWARYQSRRYWHVKFRASRVFNVDGNGRSFFRGDFEYVPGRTVVPCSPFSRRQHTCAPGIHFFLTLEEAKAFTY